MAARLVGRALFPGLLCLVAALSFFLLHMLWPLTLPTPWVDEAHFMIPSFRFAQDGSFAGDRMLVHQVYWVPCGFYVLDGSVFRLSGHATIQAARVVSFLCVTVAALVLRSIVSVALDDASRGTRMFGDAAVLGWYVSLPVSFAADLARPEAPVLLLAFGALDCVLRQRLLGACGLALLAALVHPLLALPGILVIGCVLPAMGRRPAGGASIARARWWEWLVALLAGGILALELSRLIQDLSQYEAQWRFQLARKATRGAGFLCLSSGLATVSAFAAASLLCLRHGASPARRAVRSGLVVVFACGAIFVDGYGQEMWYFPFLLAGLILLLCVVAGSLRPGRRAGWASVVPVASAGILALGLSTWAAGLRPRGVFGFQVRPAVLASIAADREYVASNIMRRLRDQDARAVLIEPSFFLSFPDDRRDRVPQIFTWSPLSRPAAVRFDHLMVLERGYPSANPLVPAGLLAGYVCTASSRVASPDRRYEAALLTIKDGPSRSRAFLPCGTDGYRVRP